MAETIIFISGAYHLGNNPGVFQSASFAGLSLTFPATLTWKPTANNIALVLHTHDVESWGGTGGHTVKINQTKVGEIKDVNNADHPNEVTTIPMVRTDFEAILPGKDYFTIGIELHLTTPPSMADDFVLTRIDTVDFAAKLGA